MKLSKLARQTTLLSAIPLAFLLLLLAISLTLQAENARSERVSQHATQLLSEADRAQSLMSDGGRALLAFERSGHTAALAPYYAATAAIPSIQRSLLAGNTTDPLERARARRLATDIGRGMDVLRQYLRDLQRHDPSSATTLGASDRVRRLDLDLDAAFVAFKHGELVTLALESQRVSQHIGTFTIVLIAVSLLGTAATLVTATRFGTSIARRVLTLAENAQRLARGEATQPLSGDDEIARLDRIYHELARRVQREHDIVRILQNALLPQELPRLPGLRLDAAYVPALAGAEIGGDWYDVFQIDERSIGISIGDVGGHGLRAAATMDATRQAIRTLAHIDSEPARVVARTNEVLCRNTSADLVTAFFGTFDLYDGTLRYCFAGHLPPIVLTSSGTHELLDGQGLVLGVDPHAAYETRERKFDVGSAVVFYTDGLVEAGRNYAAGLEDLLVAIEDEYRNASHNIAEAIQTRIFSKTPPRDDSALLFLGVTALGAPALERTVRRWKIDARDARSARRFKRAVLWHLGVMTGRSVDLSPIEPIVAELLGNVARHTPGPAEVVLEWNEGTPIIRFLDRGPRFSRSAAGGAVDLLAENGRGLFLVEALSRELTIEWTGRGNCVSALLPIDTYTNGKTP